MATVLWLNGFEVRADLASWRRPERIGHFVPDVSATSADFHPRRIIAEIEEEHSLFRSHSVRQILYLAGAASRLTTCYLVVPRPGVALAKLLPMMKSSAVSSGTIVK
jgi:hypothetical protein